MSGDDADPFWTTWLDVSSRRNSEGFSALSEVEGTFFAMNLLVGAVQRGGFHPYFDMAGREEIEAAKAGFRGNGAPVIAGLIQRAEGVLFPEGIPERFEDQLDALPCWTHEEIDNNMEPPWSVALEQLDDEFYRQSALAYEVVARFFEGHLAKM